MVKNSNNTTAVAFNIQNTV